MADTPVLDRILAEEPHCLLRAHGVAVGLPSDADMGNSEVGHNAMGAGRVVDQGAKLVDIAIASGGLWQREVWKHVVARRAVHFIGLVSDGNVHSHVDHLRALINRAKAEGVPEIYVHALTDGRDVSGRSALTWVEPLERDYPDVVIASGGGRMHITMDRYEADWAMVERGWNCHVHGRGRCFASASEAIRTLYAEDPKTDDQWLPAFVTTRGRPIQDGDAVVFFNFRGDRAIEISRAFEDLDFPHFDRGRVPNVYYAGMMLYDGDAKIPRNFLVKPPAIDRTVGQYLAAAGLRTYALSETQKFGHVTYFFNGNRSGLIDPGLERYDEVTSDVIPFDRAPAMKAEQIADATVNALRSGDWDHIRLNFANGDMVGHTGDFAATVSAVQTVDHALGRVLAAAAEVGAIVLVTADHGNADQMVELDKKGAPILVDGHRKPRTSHSLNPVPFVVIDPQHEWTVDPPPEAGIASIGATLLTMLGLPVPDVYLPPLVRRAR